MSYNGIGVKSGYIPKKIEFHLDNRNIFQYKTPYILKKYIIIEKCEKNFEFFLSSIVFWLFHNNIYKIDRNRWIIT